MILHLVLLAAFLIVISAVLGLASKAVREGPKTLVALAGVITAIAGLATALFAGLGKFMG